MSRSYAPSTIDVIGDLTNGLHVETPVFTNVVYFLQNAQKEIFNVYGRILLLNLFIEAITVSGAGAAQVLFNFTGFGQTKPLCSKCASIAALPQGGRIVWVGGIVATATVITVAATGGVSDVTCRPLARHIIGSKGGVATIGTLTTDGSSASGTSQASIFYAPLSDDAYVTSVF
jgi:ribosomal protein S27E